MMTRQTILAVVLLASTASQARWYSSETGRFLSDDEVPAAQKLLTPTALDPWSYAAGNPLRYADPTGRVPMDPTPTMTANASCGGAGHPNCSGAQYQARFDADMRGQLAGTVGQLAVMCAVVPGCKEALVLAGKYFGIGYTAAWLAGTQGHREDGSLIESIPDPVTATLDGIGQGAAECREAPGATLACGATALVVVPPLYSGTRGVGRALGAWLSPSVELGGALDGMAAAESRALQASFDAAEKTYAEQGMARVGEAYTEMYGPGEMAGIGGGETEAGWWGGSRSNIGANKAAGDAVRDAIARREGFPGPQARTEVTMNTVGGPRRLDVLLEPPFSPLRIEIESKVGRTGLGPRERQELARDWWLLRQKELDRVRWEFSPSDVTGEVGPTGPLERKLRKLGFDIQINKEAPK